MACIALGFSIIGGSKQFAEANTRLCSIPSFILSDKEGSNGDDQLACIGSGASISPGDGLIREEWKVE